MFKKEYFSVYIIESPSPENVLDQTSEGDKIQAILSMSEIKNKYFSVMDQKILRTVFEKIADDMEAEVGQGRFFIPFIHISCHADAEKLTLTNGDFITYQEFNGLLKIINDRFPFIKFSPIHLCLSACEGLNLISVDDYKNKFSDFGAVIGSLERIPWVDSLIAFTVFYHNYINLTMGPFHSVDIMNRAINKPLFRMYFSEGIKELLTERGLKT